MKAKKIARTRKIIAKNEMTIKRTKNTKQEKNQVIVD